VQHSSNESHIIFPQIKMVAWRNFSLNKLKKQKKLIMHSMQHNYTTEYPLDGNIQKFHNVHELAGRNSTLLH